MPKNQPTIVLTPAGRIVYGHPRKLVPKIDQQTSKPILKADGTPAMIAMFGLAISKAEFAAVVWPAMQREIATGYPNGIPGNFSYKYKDGDSVDKRGQPYSKREGYAGNYVLHIQTEVNPPQVVKLENGQYVQIADEAIKTGDFVRAELGLVVNVPVNNTHTPSLFVNPNIVEFLGFGQPIFNGPNAMDAFGGAAVALPAGASATPLAPVGGTLPGVMPLPAAAPLPATMPGMPAPAAMMPGVAMPGMPAAMVPQQPGAMPGMPGQPLTVPGVAPLAGMPAGMPGAIGLPGTAYPSNAIPVQPAHDFVQNAGVRQPVGYDPATGRPIFGYTQQGQPIFQ